MKQICNQNLETNKQRRYNDEDEACLSIKDDDEDETDLST